MRPETIQMLPPLSSSFRGEVIGPLEGAFDDPRGVHAGSIHPQPAVVLRPHGAADVIDAVAYAQEAGLPLAVRASCHGVPGSGVVADGVVIDLSAMRGVHVNIDRGTALALGGTSWGEFDRETQLFDLATPGARVSTSSVGGSVLCGGYGWLSPLHGLTSDNLIGAELVTADGRLLHISEFEHPELLWALRGAGANFGVVTSYLLRAHRISPELLGGVLLLPNDARSAEAVRAYRDVVEQADPRLVTAMATMVGPAEPFVPPSLVGKPVLAIVALWVGSVREGSGPMSELQSALPGAFDTIRPTTYPIFQTLFDGFAPAGWQQQHRSHHLAALTDPVIESYLEVGRDIASPMTQGIIYRHGGVVSRVREDATAASHRAAPYLAHASASWSDPAQADAEQSWMGRFREAVAPNATGGTHLDLESCASPMDVRAGYGPEKLHRLSALKDEWDPDNVFRSNHNVPPTSWAETSMPRQRPREPAERWPG